MNISGNRFVAWRFLTRMNHYFPSAGDVLNSQRTGPSISSRFRTTCVFTGRAETESLLLTWWQASLLTSRKPTASCHKNSLYTSWCVEFIKKKTSTAQRLFYIEQQQRKGFGQEPVVVLFEVPYQFTWCDRGKPDKTSVKMEWELCTNPRPCEWEAHGWATVFQHAH